MPTLAGWAQLFCAVLVYSLQGETVERQVDARFNNLPVALYTKYFGTLIWFYLYFRILRQIVPIHRLYPWIERVFVLVVVIGLISMPLVVITAHNLQERDRARDLVTGIRDLGMLLPAMLVFIPLTWQIRQRERVGGMRLKQLVIVLCYAGYIVIAFANIFNAILALLDPNPALELKIEALITPVLLLSLLLFVLVLAPYRWMTVIHYPRRLLTYHRLRRLERHILRKLSKSNKLHGAHPVLIHVESSGFPAVPFQLEALELEIYRAVINILDYADVLAVTICDEDTRTLAAQIQNIAKTYPSYGALVYHLSRIKHD